MKILKYSFLMSLLLITQIDVFAGRGNPIMVIELDCGDDETPGLNRDRINVREITRTIDCVDDTCPNGYIKTDNEVCECIPDCASLFPDCETCTEFTDVEWFFFDGDDESGYFCGCMGEGPVSCGCPEWFTEVPFDSPMGISKCDIVQKPCYTGSLDIFPELVSCQLLGGGMVSATVIVELGPGQEGKCVSIVDLQNCELSNDADFVVALASQYEATAAFCADPGETTIELDFTFDSNGPTPTWVWYDFENDIESERSLISPDAVCAAPIPTLSTWMILSLGLIMAISGILFVKRKEVRKVLGAFMMSF